MRGSSSKQLVPCRSSLSWSFFEEGACVKIRKVLTVALLAFLCLSLYFASAPASAEDIAVTEQEGLCVHHPAHTAACGYEPETEAGVCTHVHDESCGYVVPVEEQPCAHVHDETCGYAEAEEEVPCDQDCTDLDGDDVLDHIEGCAYQPAVEGQPCTHVHDETCGYVPPVEEQPCTHIHDETCGYGVPAAAGVCIYAEAGCPYCVVDWQWSDPQQMLTQEEDGSWSLYVPGVSASAPISRQGLQGLLPEEIAVYMDDTTRTTIAIAWDLAAVPDDAAGGDYLLEAYPADGTYALTETAQPLEVTLRLGGAETYELVMPSGTPPYSKHIVTGVSPAGTTINLFDYWLVDRTTRDDVNPPTNDNDPSTWLVNLGINNGHALQFSKGNNSNSKGLWNLWTNSSAPRVGMVQNKLSGGYPRLQVDTANVADAVIKVRDGDESMAYLFDPNIVHTGKQSFKDVKGLLQVDADGYYYYDSTKNYAVYYSDTNSFTLYAYPGVKPGGSSPVGQFFPFNEANADAEVVPYKDKQYTLMNKSTSTDAPINHYFGIHMSTRFIQQYGGHTTESKEKAVTYEFSGDDDVWIFIDGKLVVDLGGIHDRASVKINFATGDVYVNDENGNQQEDSGEAGYQHYTLRNKLGLTGNTLPDNTYHTLDLFYLERGNTDSNLKLRYNLVTIPESSVIKVDQVGDPVPGAEFSLYAAGDLNTPIATGTTNSNGEFVFVKQDASGDERPITIQELYSEHNNVKDEQGNNLILKETSVPEGYRTNGEIGLSFYQTPNNEVLLLSNSIWDKGAYAMPKVTATVKSNTIHLLRDGSSTEIIKSVSLEPEKKPLMFAVVYQKQENNTWLPVSGDPLNGWNVHEDSRWSSVLAAARNNPYIFQLASSGAYQVEVSNLPGEIKNYYYICNSETQAEYTIAYYYTEASTLSEAKENNTWRISSDQDELNRVFSVNLYVSNIKNRLLVQKVNEDGEVITTPGFVFSLYEKNQVTLDQYGNVKSITGEPYDQVTTSSTTSIPNFTGGGIFPTARKVLANGEYYLVETSAPYGYKKSEKATHIVVDHTGVYADAGVADDGIEVLRGVGSIIHSMVQFAADDDVDITLNHIKAALAGATFNNYQAEGSFTVDHANWDSDSVLHLQYANQYEMLDYGLVDSNKPGMPDDLTIATDAGWSKLLIRQCETHKSTGSGAWQNLKDQDITNLFSGTVTVRVTNERVGNLTISKKVISSSGETPPSDISFTFALKNQTGDAPITGTYETVDQDNLPGTILFGANGEASLELKADESLTILGLPYGSQYTVREVLQPGYNVSTSTDDGAPVEGTTVSGNIPHSTQENDDKTVVFTNDYDGQTRVSIHVQKTMLGRNIKQGETFEFTIEAYNEAAIDAVEAGNIELPGKLTLTGTGNATEMQGSFGMITFQNNPENSVTYTFAIKEVIPQGATPENEYVSGGVSYDPHTAIVSVTVVLNQETNKWEAQAPQYDNSDALTDADEAVNDAAAFTNTGAYDLTIEKQVTGEMGDRDKLFEFAIRIVDAPEETYPYTLTDASGTKKEGTIRVQNDEGSFQLSHGQRITIHGIPNGTTYTIAEPGAREDGYSVTPSGSPTSADVEVFTDGRCTGTLDQPTTVTYTNQKATAVPTGIRLDTLPWLLTLLCGLGGCAALCVTGKIRRRKGGCGRTHG